MKLCTDPARQPSKPDLLERFMATPNSQDAIDGYVTTSAARDWMAQLVIEGHLEFVRRGGIAVERHAIAPPEHRSRVTYHAVTRYIQRIMCVCVETPEGMPHKQVALAHCEAVDRTIDDIKAVILCPAVIAACLAGMTTVTTRDFRVIVTPVTGVIVTVAEPRGKRIHRRRLQLKSRREHQKAQKEIHRRQKRRPAPSARPSESEGGA